MDEGDDEFVDHFDAVVVCASGVEVMDGAVLVSTQFASIHSFSSGKLGQGNKYLPDHRQQHLNTLHIRKSLYELRPRILQTINPLSKQKLRRNIQRHAIKQIHNINRFTRSPQKIHHGLCLPIKNLQIANPIPDKHRSNQVPALMPLLAIRGEDTITQERRPEIMETWTLPVISEITRQHGFDMLRLARVEGAHDAPGIALDAVRAGIGGIFVDGGIEEF